MSDATPPNSGAKLTPGPMRAAPRPLTEEELEAIEHRATAEWSSASADVLRLVAEVRALRATLGQRRSEEPPPEVEPR